VSDPRVELCRLLDMLTTAAETGHGYLPARRAIREYVEQVIAERDALRKALRSTVDDLGPLI